MGNKVTWQHGGGGYQLLSQHHLRICHEMILEGSPIVILGTIAGSIPAVPPQKVLCATHPLEQRDDASPAALRAPRWLRHLDTLLRCNLLQLPPPL